MARAAAPAASTTPEVDLRAWHRRSVRNRECLLQRPHDAARVGCFCCLKTFHPTKIKRWLDHDETAACPHCNIDAVIPTSDLKLLRDMRRYWFASIHWLP